MKTFFDGIYIEKERLEEADIRYPIKLEYFKTYNVENTKAKYGIEVVKTEYLEGNIRIETKEVKNITNNIEEAEQILTLLRNNEVTPVGVEDVLQEILSTNEQSKIFN